MASTRNPPPCYHVVPRFEFAAQGGALQLGVVVNDLLKLQPLNRGQIVSPEEFRYPPVRASGFTETRSRLREGHGGIWALAYASQGASADASSQQEAQRTVSCDAIITTYFDPSEGYVAQSLAVRGVDEYFMATSYEKDVYLVTGLKVAKNLRYGSTTSGQHAANANVAGQEPNTGVQLGANVGGTANDGHNVEFEVDDIVVGFRVRRYAYESASSWNPLSNKKKLTGDDYLVNAEMYEDAGKGIQGPEVTYKQVPIEEEQHAQRKAEASGELDECWVLHQELA
ncbi:hypothetical protein CEP54_012968 [Fusarium duplospermum]|uniref:Uncharacterized protein n=1 Tax=Fusarium duplospermum TaxID=1325734 RepID=A0A428P5P7_9HYPO|nr:hypothetical protein CEP54_012968 [Fusarium duplospermum]